MRKAIGDFELEVWTGGGVPVHPIWIHLRYEDKEFKFTHYELADLKHAIAEAEKAARNALPEQYKAEV